MNNSFGVEILQSADELGGVKARAGLVERADLADVAEQFAVLGVAESEIWRDG